MRKAARIVAMLTSGHQTPQAHRNRAVVQLGNSDGQLRVTVIAGVGLVCSTYIKNGVHRAIRIREALTPGP